MNTQNIHNPQLYGLDQSHLTTLANGQLLASEVLQPFERLRQAASQAGFDLQLASSYRSFERQQAIWNAKFDSVRPILDIDSNPVDTTAMTPWQKCQAILLFSALPGASRHHWGCDFDYYDANGFKDEVKLQLIEAEYSGNGPCAGLNTWLQRNAGEFGFFFPYRRFRGGVASEPWHLSYAPVAQEFQAAFKLETLNQVLLSSPVSGKQAIVEHIQEIADRYIHNICEVK